MQMLTLTIGKYTLTIIPTTCACSCQESLGPEPQFGRQTLTRMCNFDNADPRMWFRAITGLEEDISLHTNPALICSQKKRRKNPALIMTTDKYAPSDPYMRALPLGLMLNTTPGRKFCSDELKLNAKSSAYCYIYTPSVSNYRLFDFFISSLHHVQNLCKHS